MAAWTSRPRRFGKSSSARRCAATTPRTSTSSSSGSPPASRCCRTACARPSSGPSGPRRQAVGGRRHRRDPAAHPRPGPAHRRPGRPGGPGAGGADPRRRRAAGPGRDRRRRGAGPPGPRGRAGRGAGPSWPSSMRPASSSQLDVETLTEWVEEHRVHLSLGPAGRPGPHRGDRAAVPPPVSRGVDQTRPAEPAGRPLRWPRPTWLPAAGAAGGPRTAVVRRRRPGSWAATPRRQGDRDPTGRPARGARRGRPRTSPSCDERSTSPSPSGPANDSAAETPAEDGGEQYYDPEAPDGRRLGGRLRRRL